jgi:uncharacterized protein (DUF58 family)
MMPSEKLTPDFKTLEFLGQLGRIDLVGKLIGDALLQGLRRSRKHGFSTEFSDYKSYTPGDDLRFLDWRVFARTDRLLTRKYEAETSLESMLLLDASRSMAWQWEESTSKLEYGIHLFAAMAYLHIGNQDRVGLMVSDASALHFLPPRSNQTQLDQIYHLLSEVRPSAGSTLPAMIEAVAPLKKHRGQIVICSDLEEEESGIETAFEWLAGRKDEIVVIHLLDQAEVELPFRGTTHCEDSETQEVLPVDLESLRKHHAETIRDFADKWKQHCRTWGFRYCNLHTGLSPVEALMRLAVRE